MKNEKNTTYMTDSMFDTFKINQKKKVLDIYQKVVFLILNFQNYKMF